MKTLLTLLKNLLLCLDQCVNCVIRLEDGWGFPDESISARAWRLREQHPRLLKFIDALFFFDTDLAGDPLTTGYKRRHCQIAYENEINRKHLPKEYRP